MTRGGSYGALLHTLAWRDVLPGGKPAKPVGITITRIDDATVVEQLRAKLTAISPGGLGIDELLVALPQALQSQIERALERPEFARSLKSKARYAHHLAGVPFVAQKSTKELEKEAAAALRQAQQEYRQQEREAAQERVRKAKQEEAEARTRHIRLLARAAVQDNSEQLRGGDVRYNKTLALMVGKVCNFHLHGNLEYAVHREFVGQCFTNDRRSTIARNLGATPERIDQALENILAEHYFPTRYLKDAT